jgi:hypothetical protein
MVPYEIISVHAVVADTSNFAGRWICQQQSAMIFMENVYLEMLLETCFLILDVMTKL